MTVFFSKTANEEFTGITVLIGGEPYPISIDHPKFSEINDILINSDQTPDEEDLLALVKPIKSLDNSLRRLSDRLLVQGNAVLFDGAPIDNSLSQHLVRILNSENEEERTSGYQNVVKFFEKLQTNPSDASKDHLFDFAAHHHLTITDEGDLLLYKGTNKDGTATHSGYGIVTTADGKSTIYTNSYLPNDLGSIVEIPRHMVDENRHAACSVGLHVGAFSFVKSNYNTRVWNVIVNPRDVVSVPHDAGSAKIRVARYQIVGENEKVEEHGGHSINLKTDPLPGAAEEAVVEFEEAINAELNEDNAAAAEIEDAIADLPPISADDEKVSYFKGLITGSLLPGGVTKLGTYKNKRITSAQRANFQRAMDELGLK
jgi:hypothetical protein